MGPQCRTLEHVFDGSGEMDWRLLAAADPDAGYLDTIARVDRMPPDYDGDASESSSGSNDERWSRLEPSGWVMDRLTVAGGAALTADQCLEAIAGWEKVIACAQAAQLREIARFAALRPGREPGTGTALAADEIAVELQWTRVAANNRLALAQTLTDRLPSTLAALAQGQIDLRKAQAVCEETGALSDEQAQAVSSHVLARAADRDVSTISWWRTTLRRQVIRVDPAGADRRHQQHTAERRVVLTPYPEGMAELSALLPAPQAQAIYATLDVLARRAKTAGDDRSMDQRRADCLTDLLLDHHRSGRGPGMNVQVRVTVAASTLLGLDELPAELAGYGPITAQVARQLAADATWRRLLTDPVSGTLLDYGNRTYRPPQALADHVRTRDQYCVFPGCRHPAEKCDLDHSTAHGEGGPTADTNLGPQCRHHHNNKTHHGWTVTQSAPGVFDWISPAGRHYRVIPEPLAEPAVESLSTPTPITDDDIPPF
jgi:Domain of unknown function (DUF222)